ncbi:MAG: toll/interleukin-1 receptor domain-containing protein, partial [Bacteroidota bacterium]
MIRLPAPSAQALIAKFDRAHEDSLAAHRLNQVGALLNAEGKATLGQVLDEVFPGADQTKRLNSLNKWRSEIKKKAETLGLSLEVVTDNYKAKPLHERWLWLTGEDPNKAKVLKSLAELKQPKSELKSRIEPQYRKVRYFVSYAHEDQKEVNEFLHYFDQQAKLEERKGNRYRLEAWKDDQLVLGQFWFSAIQEAIAACDFGLLLLSPRFLTSDFILEHELSQ